MFVLLCAAAEGHENRRVNTTKVVTKGYAIGSAGLAVLVLVLVLVPLL